MKLPHVFSLVSIPHSPDFLPRYSGTPTISKPRDLLDGDSTKIKLKFLSINSKEERNHSTNPGKQSTKRGPGAWVVVGGADEADCSGLASSFASLSPYSCCSASITKFCKTFGGIITHCNGQKALQLMERCRPLDIVLDLWVNFQNCG